MPVLNPRRRALLKGGLASSALLAARSSALAAPQSPVFTLGVASGYPVPDGVSLWTRLAPEPLKPNGGMTEASATVSWEVARGADFSSLLAQGSVQTHTSAAHSAHVDVRGLPSDHPDVYAATSLLTRAEKLERPLLIIHGLADDNVLVAHSLRLSSALLAAGRSHAVLPLSGVTHMTPQEVVAENLLRLEVGFLAEHLHR